jgi:hypothetical protein
VHVSPLHMHICIVSYFYPVGVFSNRRSTLFCGQRSGGFRKAFMCTRLAQSIRQIRKVGFSGGFIFRNAAAFPCG